MGYILDDTDNTESEKNLFTGICPLDYCKPFAMSSGFVGFELTNQASKSALEKKICAKNRYGTLCG